MWRGNSNYSICKEGNCYCAALSGLPRGKVGAAGRACGAGGIHCRFHYCLALVENLFHNVFSLLCEWKEQPIQSYFVSGFLLWMGQASILWDLLLLPWLLLEWGSYLLSSYLWSLPWLQRNHLREREINAVQKASWRAATGDLCKEPHHPQLWEKKLSKEVVEE